MPADTIGEHRKTKPKQSLRRGTDTQQNRTEKERYIMLWTIAVVLIALWLLGIITSTTIGGFIHVLLVIAIIIILVNVIRRGKV
jgi:uncharacterized membrane protein